MTAYPEPIPILKGKDAERMIYRLQHPKPLTKKQKAFYREAAKLFGKKCPDDCKGHSAFALCVGCSRYPNLRDKYESE
jgi:hypothetical protein